MTFKSIPEAAKRYGFILEGLGAHSSRTIMVAELSMLLAACSWSALPKDYAIAAVDENVLLKQTEATRRKSLRYLRELYSLDRQGVVFRSLREMWDQDLRAQPMLALLCALARDPSLRNTTSVILQAEQGAEVTSQALAASIIGRQGHTLNQTTLAKIGRNTASSWTQSGHLQGRTYKVRVTAPSHPASVAYALFLGYLCGSRGEALFHTDWAQLLDTPFDSLHEQAFLASQQGWLDYRHAGAVTEIGFSYLLRTGIGADE